MQSSKLLWSHMAHNVWVLCYTPYQAKSIKDVEEGTLALAVHRMLHIQECVDTLPGLYLIEYSTTKDQLATHKL